jgi:hypothetical protein
MISMRHQPLEIQTLYAELVEQLAAFEAQRAIGHLSGTFVTKTIKGADYYYFQYLEPGDKKRQVYLGRRSAALDAVAARYTHERKATAPDVASIQRLCALLRAGGAMTTDTSSARVLRGLADAAVFRLGGVLVGTHAFIVAGNLLGVTWDGAALRTQDVDVAAGLEIGVAMPELVADVPGALESLEMGFLPVPGLDPLSPTTSFKVRGQGLRVDLLTPARRGGSKPVPLPRFSAAAQPLKFLDYVTEMPVAAAVVNGGGVLVNVPDPARFAWHKLIVAGERPAVLHAKRDKDLWQAAQLLEVLAEERAGDVVLAWEALAAKGSGWTRRASSGLRAMRELAPDVVASVEALTL